MSSVHAVVISVVGVLCVSLPLFAHHNAATVYNLDESAEVSLVGTVTRVDWQNPHIHLYVDVKGKDGKVVNYAVEGGTPNSLYRRGWRKDSVKPGDVVKIENAAPSRNGTPRVHLGAITTTDGRQLFSGRN
jgi:ABC-type nitrate/sulfonate/bicarbonate transport system substrate-binding protein